MSLSPGSPWTAQQVAELRRRDAEGQSAAFVADRIGHTRADCDLMRWVALGLSDFGAALQFNNSERGIAA